MSISSDQPGVAIGWTTDGALLIVYPPELLPPDWHDPNRRRYLLRHGPGPYWLTASGARRWLAWWPFVDPDLQAPALDPRPYEVHEIDVGTSWRSLLLGRPNPEQDDRDSAFAAADDFTRELLLSVMRNVEDMRRVYREHGRDLVREYLPEVLGRAMVDAVIAEPSPWTDEIGPLLRRAGVAARLQISDEDVLELTARRQLLQTVTSEGIDLFPEFQFSTTGVIEGFAEVLREFQPDIVDAWTIAGWFCTPQDELDGRTPTDALSDSEAQEALRQSARDANARFRQ